LKTIHFDCFAGISGDMTLGALVDLGVDSAALRAELAKLKLDGWTLDFVREQRNGIYGTQALVRLHDEPEHTHERHEAHEHEHGGHHHDHEHGQEHPGHNAWREIRALIEAAELSRGAKERALAIFTRVAQAEAEVHGVALEEVAFHEVGALDSIIDIVGAAICLDLLRPDRITCGPVELGGGTVRCAHGILPVPAPATLILCRGMPVKTGGFDKEMTTPTGAAILAASVDAYITGGSFTQIKTGYGVGRRVMDKPNLLRVSLREEQDGGRGTEADWQAEELALIETNIDDMSGEAFGFLMERLFAGGALDVTFTPCVMKKSRPGTIVSVLCPPEKLDALRRTVFEASTAIGLRETGVRRLALRREQGGQPGAAAKTVFLDGKVLRSKIEYEDRACLARERGVSLDEAERMLRR
jgi:uncharacterized protein (TIGR00299 family) protein